MASKAQKSAYKRFQALFVTSQKQSRKNKQKKSQKIKKFSRAFLGFASLYTQFLINSLLFLSQVKKPQNRLNQALTRKNKSKREKEKCNKTKSAIFKFKRKNFLRAYIRKKPQSPLMGL